MRTVETTVCQFDELDDRAKEKAREWWRECEAIYFDPDYDDFAAVADILGIDLRTRPVKLMGGGTRYDPCIYFSGFSSQGDGACFEGDYSYKKGSVAAIKAYAPLDTELHRIAQGLADVQRSRFYRLGATVKHRGHYYHEGCTDIEVSDREDNYRDIGDAGETVREFLRDFMRWIYRQLEKEYEWRMSDENVDESIRINEYEFDEDGALA